MSMTITVINANPPVLVVDVALQLKGEHGRFPQGQRICFVGKGHEDGALQWNISLFGDHQHDAASRDPFPQFHVFIHQHRIHRCGGLAKIYIRVIKSHVRPAGFGFHLEISIHRFGFQQATHTGGDECYHGKLLHVQLL